VPVPQHYIWRKSFKTLLISTDPAHSLADSLEQKLDDKPKPVKGADNLSAPEVNEAVVRLEMKGRRL